MFGVPSGPGAAQASAITQLSGKMDFCIEAAVILLALVRTMLCMVNAKFHMVTCVAVLKSALIKSDTNFSSSETFIVCVLLHDWKHGCLRDDANLLGHLYCYYF